MVKERWERIAWILATVLSAFLGRQIPIPTIPPPTTPDPTYPIPMPPVPQPPQPQADPVKAILKLRMGNSGCTAVCIGGIKEISGVAAITAAHCVGSVGQQGTVTTKDGKSFSCTVVRIDRRSDCAVLQVQTSEVLPFAKIATKIPPAGKATWHAGYGVDKPGNTENGEVLQGENSSGQTHFRLSVSSGDSGGPIYDAETGEVLSVVCCSNFSTRSTYGASCLSILRLIGQQSWSIEE